MSNGAPSADLLDRAKRERKAGKGSTAGAAGAGFNADERAAKRDDTPVIMAGDSFTRVRKTWAVSRAMRELMRGQESAVALSTRIRARVAELEAEQVEAAAKGDDARELELEAQITALVSRSDEATEDAEVTSYRLLALLLKPPPATDDRRELEGWGLDDEGRLRELDEALPAIELMQEHLDVEDAAALAGELTGSGADEPDPTSTSSSASTSS